MERYENYVLTSRPKHKPADLLSVNLWPGQWRLWLFCAWMTGRKGWTPKSKRRPSTCKMKVNITNHCSGEHFSLQRWCRLKSLCPQDWKQLALPRPTTQRWLLGFQVWGSHAPPPYRLLTTSPELSQGKNRVILLDPSPSKARLLTERTDETKP